MPTASLPAVWADRIQRFDHALQPIVNVHTGLCYGYEALLRGTEDAGFNSIQAVFDTAFDDDVLPAVEIALWARAIAKFARLPHYQSAKLFCNADSRGVLAQSENCDATIQALADVGLPPTSLCLEISERHHLTPQTLTSGGQRDVGRLGFRLAVDDFGRGFSGLELLYNCPSDFVKIDRFFIAGIERDRQKRVLAETMAKLAHLLGRFVVAEGVETDAEFTICRELGCDLVQGYLIQRPTIHLAELSERYDIIANIVERERRRREAAPDAIAEQLDPVPTLSSSASLSEALDAFGRMRTRSFLVIVDPDQRPLGLVREQDLKDYLYNPYGRDLLSNTAFRKPVLAILGRCPVVDIYAPIERFIDAYVQDQGNEGVIVLRDMKYAGFLDSRTLLNVVSERNLAAARDQNPLTRLPGNRRIYEFVSRALGEVDVPYTLIYLDFDHFKPFNDKFGFRQGDRALILFSEMLSKALVGEQNFVGHIGGDDFFCGTRDAPFEQLHQRVGMVVEKFRHDIESFYDAESRANGGITAIDRDGISRHFPLMRVSVVAVELRSGRAAASLEQISGLIATGKRIAKKSPDGLHVVTLSGSASPETEADNEAPACPVAEPVLLSASG